MAVFLDTNVLLYAAMAEDSASEKRSRARLLLRRNDCVLSVQVLQEFFVQATRKSRPDRLSDELAMALVATWRRFEVVENGLPVLDRAFGIRMKYRFSFWDCMIVAAALESGCERLFTEDLSSGQRIEGLIIENPFA
jgi:predicted nucleic acid-binding protein